MRSEKSKTTGPGHSGVQSVDRALDLLELLAAGPDGRLLKELAEVSELPQPTVHRLLGALHARGYVRQTSSRRYVLGPRCIHLGDSATQLLGTWLLPRLSQLVHAVGETANVAMLDGDLVIYQAQVPSRHSMRMFTEVGRRVFPHCTGVGKAILSQLPEHAVRGILERNGMPAQTERTITDVDTMLDELERVRAQGFAVDDGEQEVGVRCFALPVAGALTPTAVSVSGPGSRLTAESADQIVPQLRSVADALSEELTAAPTGQR